MTDYAQAGVNISEGDKASKIAYEAAKATFAGRAGMIGEPVMVEGGFAGLIDMGEFYLVQNDDGIGTKSIIAEAIQKYDTLGYDLLAMVIDDAACVGAEVITCSNTMDVKKVESERVAALMEGFKNACIEHKVVIPGGEIAELNVMVNNNLWNATSVGIVAKDKVITGSEVQIGDKIIALKSDGFRSNGFSLVRHILETKLGDDAYNEPFNADTHPDLTWGAAVLTPSKIYYSLIMDIHGRFKDSPKVDIHGIAHITGGGISGNITRILNEGQGAHLDNLFAPHDTMLSLQEMGEVSDEEAYKTWNMGNGMVVLVAPGAVDTVLDLAAKNNVQAQVAGEVNDSGEVTLTSKANFKNGETLKF